MSFKEDAEKWAKEQLNNSTEEMREELLEFMILGSLLYSVDKNGNKTRIKRLDRDTKFEIKPYEE